MKLKTIIPVLLSTAMVLNLSACGTKVSDSREKSMESLVEITLPTYLSGENVGAVFFLPQVERFNEKYEGKFRINIEEVPQAAYAEKMKQLAQQNKLPVLVHSPGSGGIDNQWFQQVILANDMAYDLSGFASKYPESAAHWIKDSVEYCMVDGKLICKPATVMKPIGMFYNETLYSSGQEVKDQMMDEFIAGLGDNKFAFQTADNAWTTGLFLTALIANEEGGAELLSDSADEKLWDYSHPPIINAVEKLKNFVQDHGAVNSIGAAYADAANAFMSKQAAFICNGTWMASEFEQESADKWSNTFDGGQVKATVYPGNVVLATSRTYGEFWISKAAADEEKELAEAFLAFRDSREEIEALLLAEGGEAPNVDYSKDYKEKQKKTRVLYELTQSMNQDTRYVVQIYDVMPNSVADVEFGKLLPKLLDNTLTAEEFCQELTKKAEEAKQ